MELKLHLYSITQMFAPRPSMLKPSIVSSKSDNVKALGQLSMLKPWIFEIRSSAAKALDHLIPTFDAKALDLRSRISDTEALDLRSPNFDQAETSCYVA